MEQKERYGPADGVWMSAMERAVTEDIFIDVRQKIPETLSCHIHVFIPEKTDMFGDHLRKYITN